MFPFSIYTEDNQNESFTNNGIVEHLGLTENIIYKKTTKNTI